MKSLFEEMGGTYRQEGDYLIPNLILPAQKDMVPLGKYGRMHLHFLKEHRRVLYTNLLTSGKLDEHLHEVDQCATEQVEQIVAAMAKQDDCDETLKARDQLRWVGLMNNYRHCAEEIVLKEVVYE
ncbi:MAG: TnpV protein [Eubacteriales bacterium]|nr:TnpV protein [Eubacteriales bacterium]